MRTRRVALALLLAPAGLAFAARARAEAPAGFTYKGVSVDDSLVPSGRRSALEAYLRQQIDLVQSVRIKPEIAAFFQSVPLRIDPSLTEPGHYDGRGLRLWDKTEPPGNPVLLHELLHAWHSRTDPAQKAAIRQFYERARGSGRFRPDAYMLKNPGEFFAMTGSVALSGRAAREPFTRERVRQMLPRWYDWLVETFGLQV